MRPRVIVFANPFGYGPAGKALALLDALKRHGFDDVSMAGSAHIREIVPLGVPFLDVNERSVKDVGQLLFETQTTHIVCSQNRFAVSAARTQGIKSAFLDGLAWFWKEIPEEHLIADEIFWINFPGLKDKAPAGKNIAMVPAVVEQRVRAAQEDKIVVHIGGCENPLTNTIPTAYLSLLAGALNAYTRERRILVTGGVRAIEYLRVRISAPRVECRSLIHDDFLAEVSSAKMFLTTAGMTASLEAFSMGVPVAFLPPTNLSQYALVQLLRPYGAAPAAVLWSDYTSISEDIGSLNEKEAISTFDEIASAVDNNEESRASFQKDMLRSFDATIDTEGQREFIQSVGTNGADVIARYLYNAWHE